MALVERSDFAAGTSSRSTKLIHGGIRYLEAAFKKLDLGSYKLVKEALDERAFMLESAPYMARALPLMVPLYSWWEVPYYWAGAKVYDLVAGRNRFLPASHYINRCVRVRGGGGGGGGGPGDLTPALTVALARCAAMRRCTASPCSSRRACTAPSCTTTAR